MKCASTWLHKWLKSHPELGCPFLTNDRWPGGKNPYWWNRDHAYMRAVRATGEMPSLLINSDAQYFAQANSVDRAIDVTDSASFMNDEQIDRFLEMCPGVPVSMVWRDPIEVMWSHMQGHGAKHQQLLRQALDDPNEQAWRQQIRRRVVFNGLLGKNLARWRRHGVEVHVIQYQEICDDPHAVLQGVADLIGGIDRMWWRERCNAEVKRPINSTKAKFGGVRPLTPDIRAALQSVLEEAETDPTYGS